MLRKIRMERQGERPQTLYRKLRNIKPNRPSNKMTHTASIRYNKQEVAVYLINGEWISYGEPHDQQPSFHKSP